MKEELCLLELAVVRCILLTCNRPNLVEFGGHVQLNRHWSYALLMNLVQRKATTKADMFQWTSHY